MTDLMKRVRDGELVLVPSAGIWDAVSRADDRSDELLRALEDARLGGLMRRFMEASGPIRTVSGKDVYSFVMPPVDRGEGLGAAIAKLETDKPYARMLLDAAIAASERVDRGK